MAKKFTTTNIFCKFRPKIVKRACPKCYAINVWGMRRHTCEGDRQEPLSQLPNSTIFVIVDWVFALISIPR